MKLNELIKHYRVKLNMSQAQLAEKTFTTKSSVSKWESGNITPNIDMIKIIAKALDIKFYQLIGEKENLGRRIVNIISKAMLYMLMWIHIDITIGVTLSSLVGVFGLLSFVTGIGGSIALTVFYSLNDLWTSATIGWTIVVFLGTPGFFAIFGSIGYGLFLFVSYIYYFSLRYFWGKRIMLEKYRIKFNKKYLMWFSIVAVISLLIVSIFLGVLITSHNGDWSILDIQTSKLMN